MLAVAVDDEIEVGEAKDAAEEAFDRRWHGLVRACRRWMRFQSTEIADGLVLNEQDTIVILGDIQVGASRYDKVGGPGPDAGLGSFRVALHRAHFYWIARRLPPMMRDAVFAARSHRDGGSVLSTLSTSHHPEWVAWRMRYPQHPLKALLAAASVEMARMMETDFA